MAACGHEWQAKVYVRTNGAGSPACRAVRPRSLQRSITATVTIAHVYYSRLNTPDDQ